MTIQEPQSIAQRQSLPTSLMSPAVRLSRSDAALFFLLFLLLGLTTACAISCGPVKKYKHCAYLYENEGREEIRKTMANVIIFSNLVQKNHHFVGGFYSHVQYLHLPLRNNQY